MRLSRAQVFRRDGAVELCFGAPGAGPGEFQRPSGLAVGRTGCIVVADWGNHRVQVRGARGEGRPNRLPVHKEVHLASLRKRKEVHPATLRHSI